MILINEVFILGFQLVDRSLLVPSDRPCICLHPVDLFLRTRHQLGLNPCRSRTLQYCQESDQPSTPISTKEGIISMH